MPRPPLKLRELIYGSTQVLDWVAGQFPKPYLSPKAKVVLFGLAQYLDKDLSFHPSLRELAAYCGMSRASTTRAIAELVQHQLVHRERRFNCWGDLDASKYTLLVKGSAQSEPTSAQTGPGGSAQSEPGIGIEDIHLSSEDKSKTPCSPPEGDDCVSASKGNGPASPDDRRFALFWDAYPNKKAKGAARRVWARLRVDDALLERILEAVERQKKSDDWRKEGGRFIKHPATWLNGACWEDEADLLGIDLEKPPRGVSDI